MLKGATCERRVQQFIVTSNLDDDYLPIDINDENISFLFIELGRIKNPISTNQVAGLRITIASEGKYAIDEYEGPIPWSLSTGTFKSTLVVPQYNVAYRADNTYTFKFTPLHTIPQNGYVEIWFPNEVNVTDTSYSQSSCEA